ncbi:HET-domain-containing protein [Tothia fuscella]|uniref:HET-domain-containing protein n=1 Tax=Tothia fuscella TaxID=1048955 RepID=A0A9P4P4L7_9PEZI|nr:HET-domain-containing protein [Tothia fuscella]
MDTDDASDSHGQAKLARHQAHQEQPAISSSTNYTPEASCSGNPVPETYLASDSRHYQSSHGYQTQASQETPLRRNYGLSSDPCVASHGRYYSQQVKRESSPRGVPGQADVQEVPRPDNLSARKNSQHAHYRWWIPGDGIREDVITADIQPYLGADSWVKPGKDHESMIEDLKIDSANYEQANIRISQALQAAGSSLWQGHSSQLNSSPRICLGTSIISSSPVSPYSIYASGYVPPSPVTYERTRVSSTPSSRHNSQQKDIYAPLSKNESFRVLEIFPGRAGETIYCRLIETSFGATPKVEYEALSYSWGLSSDRKPIICNDQAMRVTKNLYEALCRLRPHKGICPKKIWVDAICIDQFNSEERGHQVCLMRQIYRKAQCVIVWLGEEHDKHASSACSVICAIVHYFPAEASQSRAFYRIANEVKTSSWVDGVPDTNSDLWNSVSRLYNCEWFWRVWCIQEVVVASTAIVMWGETEILWKWVSFAAARIQSALHSVLQRYPMAGCLNAYLIFRIAANGMLWPTLSLSFHRLLELTRQFKATDERDRSFGLLGIRTTDCDPENGDLFIEPDYYVS